MGQRSGVDPKGSGSGVRDSRRMRLKLTPRVGPTKEGRAALRAKKRIAQKGEATSCLSADHQWKEAHASDPAQERLMLGYNFWKCTKCGFGKPYYQCEPIQRTLDETVSSSDQLTTTVS